MRSERRGNWAPASPSQPAGALSGPQATGDMFRQKGPPRVKAQELGSLRATPRSPSPRTPLLCEPSPGAARCSKAAVCTSPGSAGRSTCCQTRQPACPEGTVGRSHGSEGPGTQPFRGLAGEGTETQGRHMQRPWVVPCHSSTWSADDLGASAEHPLGSQRRTGLGRGQDRSLRQKLGAPGTRWPVPSG